MAIRISTAVILMASSLCGQFKTTVPLVVAPITVKDGSGHFVDGLTDRELTIYDDNVPLSIHLETADAAVSLVVLIHTNVKASPHLGKLARVGTMLSDVLAGEGGEVAIMSFSDSVTLAQPFTTDSAILSRALHDLRGQGNGAAVLDGVQQALHLLATRNRHNRFAILAVSERRDLSSKVRLADLLQDTQLQNTQIYWLTYSAFLDPFTVRPQTVWDRMSDDEKSDPKRMQPGRIKYAWPEEQEPLPPEVLRGTLLSIFTEVRQRAEFDIAAVLSAGTGGRTIGFLKQSGLERAIQMIGEEIHRQYIATFQPELDNSARFHRLRAEVKGRQELMVRTRAGYWSVR